MNILNKLIEQAKKPDSIVGSLMLRIMNSTHTGMNKWALEKFNIREETVLLDIGCGGGKTIKMLSSIITNGKIYGIDYSEQSVRESIRENAQEIEAEKVHIVQASVTDIPFPNETFNIITAFQTHYFWPDIENAMKEVFRVLKQDGEFFIVAETYKINYHMKSYKTNESLRILLTEVGFGNVAFYENRRKGWVCVRGSKTKH